MTEQSNGAVIQFDSGERNDRLVQGIILRCVDGVWRANDDTPLHEGMQFLVLGITHGLQRWEDERVVEEIKKTPGVPLPDVHELNARIPEETWEEGIAGKRPPWQLNAIVYLLSTQDAEKFCFISPTVGAKIAAARLLDRVEAMRLLNGPGVVPVVTLDSRMMRTAFGQKKRPHFAIADWRDLSGSAAPALPQSPPTLQLGTSVDPAKIGTPVKEPTAAEELNDAVGF
jgi:hypothetical protein